MISTEASFRCRVQPLCIADLLSFLADLRRDGLLTVEGHGVVVDLYLESGRLIYATSSRPRDDLSRLVLRWNDITPDGLEAAMQQVREGARLDRALLDRGGMTPAALQRARHRQALHIVLPLFGWEDGEFRFFEGEAPQGELPTVDLPIHELVAAGIRALRDPDMFAKRIPSLDRVYESLAPDSGSDAPVRLRPAESFMLDLVDGSRTIEELIEESGQPEREVRRTLFLLSILGRVKAQPQRGQEAADVAGRVEPVDAGEIVRQFNGMFGKVYRYLMREIGPVSDHLLRRSLRDMQSDHPILFSGSNLGVDGTLKLPPIRENLAGLKGAQGRGLLVDGLNELLYRELLVLRRTLGAEHEKRVLSNFRRQAHSPETRA